MIPVKIDETKYRPPVMTVVLILFCMIIYFRQPFEASQVGLIPLNFVYSLLHPEKGIVRSFLFLITAFFLHGSMLHLVGNMWYLWIFGGALENCMGLLRFLLLYFLFGIISMLVQVASNPFSTIPIVGASGAIAGMMGMYLILRPFSKIIFWFPPFFFFRIFAFIFLLFWFWVQWYSIHTIGQKESIIAWWAHISGFIGGILCALRIRLFKRFE